MVKVGVIGAGMMGRNHARIYSQMGGVELVGVADVSEATAKTVASEFGTRAYTNYEELILKEGPDAVSIAVPTVHHRNVALTSMDYGVHVLVEKPIAHTLEAAREMAEKARSSNLKLMVGHIERFNPAVTELKRVLDHGTLGKPVAMSAKRVGPFTNRIADVGVIVDVAVHDIDVMSYLFNDRISRVYAHAGEARGASETYAMMMMSFKAGGVGVIETNRLTPRKIRELTVTGTEGFAIADYIGQSLTVQNGVLYAPDLQKVEPLKAELEHFIDCVENDLRPMVNGTEGTHALEVALAGVASYQNNRYEELPESPAPPRMGLTLEGNITEVKVNGAY
jgi:UDP-N-acetylglucosamine 3-dehydrogenase